MATLPAGRAASTNASGSEDNISTINPPKKGDLVVNKAIQARTVRLVVKNDAGGPASSSILSRDEALAKAQLAGLDLVLVTAASDPWVCKLADAKREKYQRVKKEKKTKNIGSVLKEISIRGNISDHDLLIKLRRVMGFFEHGYSVRIIIVPTGHQLSLRPGRLQEIYDFILKDYLVDKYKSFVEIKPSPGSLRREMIVHPKRNASGGGGGGGGASKGAPKRTGNQKRDRKVEINKESRRENENGAED
ncbi:hypothetical protein NSK_003360 [Nannochloropsis salina CCMP1776]|uniref:Translation initiation factor 3 N-terminal domain-containing protein n=1 Tax=Nannochloropsis salina CCMP1776 TaxID=1027361 RepID=A0A4D9D140_9STRA|nr:hypothetical protein NSK_003360 [Nannochloropsis salina CCMP1776]|eukprot:TFJ85401.1 hypothetical protein NSK_003360 [Nannochloropsis salina CCMP1776]